MPRVKIRYEPIDLIVEYDSTQWELFHSKRSLAKNIGAVLHQSGFSFLIYGSVARGDVSPNSDLDFVVLQKISSFHIESALFQAGLQIIGKEIVQATPGDAIKGHIYLPYDTVLTFFLSEANEVSKEFYYFGGAINYRMLQNDIRKPGVTKKLTLIIPNENGHREINLLGNESYARELLGIHPKIIQVRKRVLLRRDKIGRTGVFVKKILQLEENFEEVLKNLADSNPAVRRKLSQ